ncbi:DUF6297 family protein [Qaidamihabitans albus]|uniref:DUF6297 family protein n=1 Tax=Qaidamihabitans albus TaxID=2795733 RepID=UPI0018F23355|nr:DUF6297 family protein [Qaidamihabitans albus]
MTAALRLPGESRLRRVLSGDWPTFVAFFAVGLLVSAFFRLAWWRDVLLTGPVGSPAVVLGLFAVCCALGWRSLLRRTFLWADPATLTWADFGNADRVRAVSGRLWIAWATRLLALGYLGAFLAALYEVPGWVWPAGGGVLLAGAVPAFVLAAGAGASSPVRLPVAVRAGRQELVEGWAERVVRTVSLTFLDPLMMLPSARPAVTGSLRRRSLPRLAAAGIVGRTRYLGSAVLLALAAAAAHVALPGIPDAVLAGLGGFAALLPFGGGLGELWRSAGLRRWVDAPDRTLRAWHGAALAALALGWGLLLLAGTALLDAPLTGTAWLVLPLVAAVVVRTVTRPPLDYGDLGMTDTPFGQAPVRLIAQLVRGPDLGIAGVWLLSVSPLGWFTVLTTFALVAWCVLR